VALSRGACLRKKPCCGLVGLGNLLGIFEGLWVLSVFSVLLGDGELLAKRLEETSVLDAGFGVLGALRPLGNNSL